LTKKPHCGDLAFKGIIRAINWIPFVWTPYSSNPKHAILEGTFKNEVDSPKSVFGLVDCTLLAAEGERDLAKTIKIDILDCFIQFGIIRVVLPARTRRQPDEAEFMSHEDGWLI